MLRLKWLQPQQEPGIGRQSELETESEQEEDGNLVGESAGSNTSN